MPGMQPPLAATFGLKTSVCSRIGGNLRSRPPLRAAMLGITTGCDGHTATVPLTWTGMGNPTPCILRGKLCLCLDREMLSWLSRKPCCASGLRVGHFGAVCSLQLWFGSVYSGGKAKGGWAGLGWAQPVPIAATSDL